MIGVFGGTFDPVHNGHLYPAQSVNAALQLKKTLFVPNFIPPHRPQPWLPIHQRLLLLEIALDDFPEFILDKRELEREGVSYMFDTLTSIRQDYPDQTIVLIIGMDALYGFEQWHRWQDILKISHIVVTQRPGFDLAELDSKACLSQQLRCKLTDDKTAIESQSAGRILLQCVPQLDLSSTIIRQRLEYGNDVTGMMPEMVYEQLMRFVEK